MISVTGDDLLTQVTDMRRNVLVALKAAVAGATAYAQQDIRLQVRAAGLGTTLPNAVRSRVFPVGNTLAYAPSGQIYAGGKKAQAILQALSEGTIIRGLTGQALAIPLDAAPKGRWGSAMTPKQVEDRYGRKLVSIPLKGRTARAMLCMPMPRTKAAKAAGGKLPLAPANADRRARNNHLVPMFILVREVRLAQRLTPQAAVDAAIARMPELFDAALMRTS